MRAALNEAKKGIGRTSPNPAVGAVLVHRGRIVGRGHHGHYGGPHAELVCLNAYGRPVPPEAILYVTLEPCSTTGRTGPCTNAIVQAGIRNVVIGTLDLNSRHRGRGISLLRQADIQVRVGILEKECARLNEAFNKWIVTRRPFVIAKCGMSLDGRLSRPPGESRWITSPAARRHAHALRAEVDAILIGAETLRKDDPRLTVRGLRRARQPWRVVVTRSGKVPLKSRLFSDRWASRTLVYRRVSLRAVLRDLGKKQILSVLLEGGGSLLGQAFDAGLIDKVQIYVGPLFTAGPVVAFGGRGIVLSGPAAKLRDISYTRLGDDICVVGYPCLPSNSANNLRNSLPSPELNITEGK